MSIIERSALLPYSDQKIFDLVNDIEAYPQFMDGCIGAELISKTDSLVTGRLELGKAGLKYSFSTRNLLNPPHSMDMELLEGPFKKFSSRWTFTALREDACKVSLRMEFEFRSGLIDMALKSLFESSSKNLVNAVCERANLLYGKAS